MATQITTFLTLLNGVLVLAIIYRDLYIKFNNYLNLYDFVSKIDFPGCDQHCSKHYYHVLAVCWSNKNLINLEDMYHAIPSCLGETQTGTSYQIMKNWIF